MNKIHLFVFAIIALSSSCNEDTTIINKAEAEVDIDWKAAADSSSESFVLTFWNAAEKCFNYQSDGALNFQYWPQAHALDVLVDAYERTDDVFYKTSIDQWYDGVKTNNDNTFYNVFYDDMEWNALAMLRAYNAVEDEKFKTASLEVWEDIKTGWNDNAEGGISWKKDQLWSKNACSNGPASILAARLFQQFGDESNKEWAKKIYAWEKEYLFNVGNGAVYDNLDSRTMEVQESWIFTYNTGTFMGAAVELYKITGETGYLRDAIKTADYTLNNLINSNDRILKSEGDGDGGLFKGIFIRYFTQLILVPDLDESVRNRYVLFLEHNAETLWIEGTNKNNLLYGNYWKEKPIGSVDLNVQLSGCMLIEAMTLLESGNIIKK